jgi:alanine racemase
LVLIAMPTLLTDSPTIDAPSAETGGAAGYSDGLDSAAHYMTSKIKFDGRPVWAEISLADILHNLKVIRRHVGARRKILAVVKANAYGLGSVPISKALAKAGAEWLGVTCSSEGIELREAGIRKRILVLTGFWAGEEEILLRHDLTPTITRLEQLRQLERAAGRRARRVRNFRAPFHLKINTGMNRLGIEVDEVDAFAAELSRCGHLKLEGTYTHFASAEDFTSDQTARQERKFFAALERLRELGVSPGLVHLANSGAICARPSTWGDLVRPGAILYGYHQGFDPPEKKAEVKAQMPLRPCLSLRARIISLRDVAAGESVGYGARFVTERPSRIAVIAAGYADGVVRSRTNRGTALLRGRRVPLVGTISMDLATVDATGVSGAAVGDIVTIYGSDGADSIEVSDVAREIGTVTSDLLCALGRRVRRFYLS